ncbi:MAG: exodeoxyribonuclease III [Acidimicrobiales bacterium]|nr:exodeoxyribonuclease III [Acidimicrobiales bacterium]MDP6297821.1 exodeoxyribonuclease III [Acidimicrobiales bacterium]HJM28968.1 exodeoxyribonuclease III [Acidimicrobiales bacterium]HJM97057.1 exodeoxyribonuclease III [Acidimicrobiales bacterium]
MRIVTWNVNSLKARMPRVVEWVEMMNPDVLCMQETKLADDAFPIQTFKEMGYQSVHHGQGRWNGVAILSRVGLEDPLSGFDDGGEPDQDARIIWATCGGVRVASAYIPNGREIGHEHYQYKLEWLSRLREHLEQNHMKEEKIAVVGDFNVAPEDRDVWDIAAFEGATHVSSPEREAFSNILDWGLTDTMRDSYPDSEGLYTFWDYRQGSFYKRHGMRIDFILSTDSLMDKLETVMVDRNARKGEKPSDHAPLLADFNL